MLSAELLKYFQDRLDEEKQRLAEFDEEVIERRRRMRDLSEERDVTAEVRKGLELAVEQYQRIVETETKGR
jgi:hypothetical protein